MRSSFADPALRRGTYDGLIISGVLAVVVVLTNVVFPASPEESDSDPEYMIQILVAYQLRAAERLLAAQPIGLDVPALIEVLAEHASGRDEAQSG